MDSTSDITLPTVNTSGYMGMDFLNAVRNTSDNYNKMRSCTLAPDKPFSGKISISSTVSSVIYYNRMIMNNDNNSNTIMEPINLLQLLYVTPERKNIQVSMAADPNNNIMNQHVPIEGMTFNSPQQHVPLERLALDD